MEKHHHPRNILDLRRPVAPAPTRPRRSFGHFHAPSIHRPRGPVMDWTGLWRDMLKYCLAIAVVALPVLFGWAYVVAQQRINVVVKESTHGFNALQTGFSHLGQRDVLTARSDFGQAQKDFSGSSSRIASAAHTLHVVPWIGVRLQTAQAALDAASHITAAAAIAAAALPDVGTWKGVQVSTDGVISGSLGPVEALSASPTAIDDITSQVQQAYDAVSNVKLSVLPKNLQNSLGGLLTGVEGALGSPDRVKNMLTVLRDLLATPDERNYLLVFQNNDEQRATGGFPGTYMLMKFQRGRFTVVDAPGSGPYALNQLVGQTMLPPQPILAVAPYWSFQDSTWFVDAPTSASSMLDMYQKARGFRPDGVFFFTPELVERLLQLTGPINLGTTPEKTIDDKNFVTTIEQEVEFNYDKTVNAPKQVLINLMPKLFSAISAAPSATSASAGAVFLDELERGNIILTSTIPKVTAATDALGWSGSIVGKTNLFTVNVVNLGGGKTDRTMKQDVALQYAPNGNTWNVTVTIHRTHQGDAKDALHGMVNQSFIRVMTSAQAAFQSIDGASPMDTTKFMTPGVDALPPDALTKAEGQVFLDPQSHVRISNESGFKTFGFWSVLQPGDSQTITLHYTLPRTTGDWSIWWRKQPGDDDTALSFTVPNSSTASFTPNAGQSGWKQKGGNWVWNGLSDYSKTLAGTIGK